MARLKCHCRKTSLLFQNKDVSVRPRSSIIRSRTRPCWATLNVSVQQASLVSQVVLVWAAHPRGLITILTVASTGLCHRLRPTTRLLSRRTAALSHSLTSRTSRTASASRANKCKKSTSTQSWTPRRWSRLIIRGRATTTSNTPGLCHRIRSSTRLDRSSVSARVPLCKKITSRNNSRRLVPCQLLARTGAGSMHHS